MLGTVLRATAGNGPQAAVFQFAPAHVPYSVRRCAVSMRVWTSGPNGQPLRAAAFQISRSSSSVRTRSRLFSTLGRATRMQGEVSIMDRSRDQLKNLGRRPGPCSRLWACPVNDPVEKRDHVPARDVLNAPLAPFGQDAKPEVAFRIVCRVRLGLGAGVALKEGRDDRRNRIDAGLGETGSLQRVLLLGCGRATTCKASRARVRAAPRSRTGYGPRVSFRGLPAWR